MSPDQENDADSLHEMIKTAAAQLGEHFDSVQIISTKQYGETDEYVRFAAGSGNYYACYGSVKEWVECMEEKSRNSQRRKDNE